MLWQGVATTTWSASSSRWAVATREVRFAPRPHPPLRETLAWTEAEFLAHFRGTPVERRVFDADALAAIGRSSLLVKALRAAGEVAP